MRAPHYRVTARTSALAESAPSNDAAAATHPMTDDAAADDGRGRELPLLLGRGRTGVGHGARKPARQRRHDRARRQRLRSHGDDRRGRSRIRPARGGGRADAQDHALPRARRPLPWRLGPLHFRPHRPCHSAVPDLRRRRRPRRNLVHDAGPACRARLLHARHPRRTRAARPDHQIVARRRLGLVPRDARSATRSTGTGRPITAGTSTSGSRAGTR